MAKKVGKEKIKNVAYPAIQTEKPVPAKGFEIIEEPLQNALPSRVSNGFGEAIGFTNPFGGQGNPFGGPAVESADTGFDNLRWYMVSNMRQLLSQLFVEIGLVQTIVCVPVDDGLRGGVLIKSKQLDEDQIKELQISMARDGDLEVAGWAAKWDRLYGGAGILVLVDDQDPEEPLDIKAIGKDTKLSFRDVDMWELFFDMQNTEGYDSSVQSEEYTHYNYYSENLHRSRVMKLKGFKAPSFVRPRLRGWGVSVVEALVRSMNQYLKATDLGFEVLDEFKLDVYKIKNLISTLLSPTGTNDIKKRIQMANWQKNYQNAIVMDSEDDFDHKQLSFAGLAEAMEGIRMQVAADMRMPILKLFGQSVTAGLGTSAPEEMENYNAMIESEIRGKLQFHILKMLELKCQQMFGMIPEDLEIEFKPLRELGPVDQETVKTAKFTRLLQAEAAGKITTLEFRDACNKGNIFDVQLDTAEDSLNPDDPEIDAVTSGEGGEEDGDDSETDERNNEPREGDKKIDKKKENKLTNHIKPYNFNQKAARTIQNSAAFDRASYEADGGDSWIDSRRAPIFENPMGVDKSLWSRAEEASQKVFGKDNWKFKVWWYKKQGGQFT
jgi:phage-related protein (TIGR01555 family)